jgi:uncharacterized protein (DUF885 family)
LFALTACGPKQPGSLAPLVDEFVYTSLAFSPSGATSQGYHDHHGRKLDNELDDFSYTSLHNQANFFASFHKRLAAVDRDKLSPEDRADAAIMEQQLALALLDLGVVRSFQRNPTVYVESLGNALFSPLVLQYAPLPERMRSLLARVKAIPHYLDTARHTLVRSPGIWLNVAREEDQGNIDLIDHQIRAAMPADLKVEYNTAAEAALSAVRAFDAFLADEMPRRSQGRQEPSWRLGTENYAMKFRFALGTDRTPDDVLKEAVADVQRVHQAMRELAAPLHAKWFPGHQENDTRTIVREVLGHIAEQHSTPGSFVDDARKDLEEARQFTAAHNLLTLPKGGNLSVIPTPEFMRGLYSVGGFNPAPALEPQLGAFYWITPIPATWAPARVESKLREYNVYNLKLLTIHEAMPGHYVQAEVANGIEPRSRRLLRGIFGNTPYVEGWAQYATQMLLDEGLLDHSPELRLTLLKQELRVLGNAIIDIRLQTNRMSEQECVDFMEKETFQEHEEAVGKLQRAQLSSGQLPSYLVGWRGWNKARADFRAAKGAAFNLHDFNDAALKEGAVPLPELSKLLAGR